MLGYCHKAQYPHFHNLCHQQWLQLWVLVCQMFKPHKILQPQFSLSSSFPPLPAKLVSKIQSLQYIDMKDLLPDNIGLARSLDGLELGALPMLATRPKLRWIPSILSWVSCFAVYVAVLSESHPHLVQSHFAYMCLIIREARRARGDGWVSYDAIFQQKCCLHKITPLTGWNWILPCIPPPFSQLDEQIPPSVHYVLNQIIHHQVVH